MSKSVIIGAVGLFAVLVLLDYVIQPPSIGRVTEPLPSTAAKAMDLLSTMTSLFVTFALGIIGAAGALLNIPSGRPKLHSGAVRVIGAGCVLAVLSIYFGHLVFQLCVEMLANGFLSFGASSLRWCIRLQYLCLVVSMVCMILGFGSSAEEA